MKFKINIAPLSVNKAWQGRRYRSKEYKDWSAEVLWLIRKQNLTTIKGAVKIKIEWGYKFAKRTDIDNPIKVLLDALTESHVIDDDVNIRQMEIKKTKSVEPYIKVEINKLTKKEII